MKAQPLNQSQAAALLGVTARRIRQRDKEDNPPPKNEAGKYPCDAFGKWMLDDFRRGLGVSEDGTVYDYEAERARFTFHQANSAEMEEQRKRRELIPAQEIRQAWADIVASARAKLLALPSRLAFSCAEKSAGDLEKEAQSIIYEALNELAEGGDGVPCGD